MSDRQDLRTLPFTCPTCGQDKCSLVFTHPFDPKAQGAALGIMHEDESGKNDPMGFAKCGLSVDFETVKALDDLITKRSDVPAWLVKSVIKTKAP